MPPLLSASILKPAWLGLQPQQGDRFSKLQTSQSAASRRAPKPPQCFLVQGPRSYHPFDLCPGIMLGRGTLGQRDLTSVHIKVKGRVL